MSACTSLATVYDGEITLTKSERGPGGARGKESAFSGSNYAAKSRSKFKPRSFAGVGPVSMFVRSGEPAACDSESASLSEREVACGCGNAA